MAERDKTVLVVDDEELVCRLARDILRREGFHVLTANGPKEAIQTLDSHHSRIDLLVTDIIMPDMNGVELAERLTEARPGLRVLFISGVLEGKLLQQETHQEIQLLEKPFLPAELVSKVNEVLERRTGRAGFLITKEETMHFHIDRKPPSIEELSAQLRARIAITGGRKTNGETIPAGPGGCLQSRDRRERSLRSCHLTAEPKKRRPAPRDTGAYVPEMAARIENDLNLTDGARRCARKLAEYFYRRNRSARSGDITVTWLMRTLGKSRRSVQRYLAQLEREGYIAIAVVYARTRMCTGLFIELLAPLFPRHHRQKWPQKRMDSDAPQMSQNNRSRYKYSRKSWALRCMDGVFRSLMKTLPPFPVFPATV